MRDEVKRTIDNLERNGFSVSYHATRDEALAALLADIAPEESVGFGGSVTLQELGVFEALKARGQNPSWHWMPDEGDGRRALLARSAVADIFLTGTNAITKDGTFVNIDGTGNRLSGMLYGHKRVLMVAGINKIVRNYEEAMIRIKNVASPLNARRLGRKTPCAVTGKCGNCNVPDRICRATLVIDRQMGGAPITLHLIGEPLGY